MKSQVFVFSLFGQCRCTGCRDWLAGLSPMKQYGGFGCSPGIQAAYLWFPSHSSHATVPTDNHRECSTSRLVWWASFNWAFMCLDYSLSEYMAFLLSKPLPALRTTLLCHGRCSLQQSLVGGTKIAWAWAFDDHLCFFVCSCYFCIIVSTFSSHCIYCFWWIIIHESWLQTQSHDYRLRVMITDSESWLQTQRKCNVCAYCSANF